VIPTVRTNPAPSLLEKIKARVSALPNGRA
jgi:hypothetical protein